MIDSWGVHYKRDFCDSQWVSYLLSSDLESKSITTIQPMEIYSVSNLYVVGKKSKTCKTCVWKNKHLSPFNNIL